MKFKIIMRLIVLYTITTQCCEPDNSSLSLTSPFTLRLARLTDLGGIAKLFEEYDNDFFIPMIKEHYPNIINIKIFLNITTNLQLNRIEKGIVNQNDNYLIAEIKKESSSELNIENNIIAFCNCEKTNTDTNNLPSLFFHHLLFTKPLENKIMALDVLKQIMQQKKAHQLSFYLPKKCLPLNQLCNELNFISNTDKITLEELPNEKQLLTEHVLYSYIPKSVQGDETVTIRPATLNDLKAITIISKEQYQTTFKSLWQTHYHSMTPANHTLDSYVEHIRKMNKTNNKDFITKQLNKDSDQRLLVAEKINSTTTEKQVVGYCRFEKKDQNSMYINFILVDKPFCKQGIAKQLAFKAMQTFDDLTQCNFRALIHNDFINDLI